MISSRPESAQEQVESEQSQRHGRWEPEECEGFIKFYEMYGDNWKAISREIGTRTAQQVRSHAQKYFIRVERERQKLKRKECQKKNVPTQMENKLRPRACKAKNYTTIRKTQSQPKQQKERRERKKGKEEKVDVETQTDMMFPPPITFPFYLQFLSPYLFRQNVPLFFKEKREDN